MEFQFMDSVYECDNRLEDILYCNMWILSLMTVGLTFVTYQYGRLEVEYRNYRELVEAEQEDDVDDESCDDESGEETGDDSGEDNDTDVVKEDEVEGVRTRSWFS